MSDISHDHAPQSAADSHVTPRKEETAVPLSGGLMTFHLTALLLGFGLLGAWLLNAVYRVGQALVCAQQWAGRKWAHIDV